MAFLFIRVGRQALPTLFQNLSLINNHFYNN